MHPCARRMMTMLEQLATLPSPAPPALVASRCPWHSIKRLHYCDYLHLPEILASINADARTPDEMFFVGGLGSYVLLLSLLERELLALGRHLRDADVSPGLINKIAARCRAVAQLAQEQGPLLRAVLVHRWPRLRFRLSAFD